MKLNTNPPNLIAALLLMTVLVASCTSDVNGTTSSTGGTTGSSGGTTAGQNTTSGGTTISTSGSTGAATNGTYSLTLSSSSVNLVEGSTVSIAVQVQRSDGYDNQVTLAIEGQSDNDVTSLGWTFSDTRISASETSATININMDYSVLPIQRQTRTLRIVGTDGSNQSVVIVTLNIEPTNLPDVYLLVGQSNMVGFSQSMSKQADPGGPDAPDSRIQQLNVTGNDQENFDSIVAFTDDNAIANPGQRLSLAVDPLHAGFDSRINGKDGTRVGLGLSFAKRAIANTQATVYLVPAAWSDSGFCRRPRDDFEGLLGWNATETTNPVLSGKLLHDRAIARANLTLRETGGILRGILWHQGEADSAEMDCAVLYEQNMRDMVASLRTQIASDARGTEARGPNANVPFVLGTMSKGGEYDLLLDPKLIVDGVHRNIKQVVPFSAYVNNDDLIPPDYPCGEGDCVHFGATAYREMGSRYYDFLLQAATGQ